MGRKMEATVGASAVALDARFRTIRSSESNVGNFVVDLLREGSNADIAILMNRSADGLKTRMGVLRKEIREGLPGELLEGLDV